MDILQTKSNRLKRNIRFSKYWSLAVFVTIAFISLVTSILLRTRQPVAPTVPQGNPQAFTSGEVTYQCDGPKGPFTVYIKPEEQTACPKLDPSAPDWGRQRCQAQDPTLTIPPQNKLVSEYRVKYTIRMEVPSGAYPYPATARTFNFIKNTNSCIDPGEECGVEHPTSGGTYCVDLPVVENVTMTLNPGESREFTLSRTSASGFACGSYQVDAWVVTGSDCTTLTKPGGTYSWGFCQTGVPCTSTTPTPTPTPANACVLNFSIGSSQIQCRQIKIYKDGVSVQPSSLSPGDSIVFGVAHIGGERARILVNGESLETDQQNGVGEFVVEYTIPSDVTSLPVTAEIQKNGIWY